MRMFFVPKMKGGPVDTVSMRPDTFELLKWRHEFPNGKHLTVCTEESNPKIKIQKISTQNEKARKQKEKDSLLKHCQ